MGYYINPKGKTKEEWLNEFGTPLNGEPEHATKNDAMAVALIDNGVFTAAGIMYSQQELEYFKADKSRPMLWFYVPIERLVDVCPALSDAIRPSRRGVTN